MIAEPQTSPLERHLNLASALGISPLDLALRFGLSERTWQRRQKQEQFERLELIQLQMYEDLYSLALQTLGSDEAARDWFFSKLPSLGLERPIDALEDLEDYNQLRNILLRGALGLF
jgi:uncharacterized protein (DUF2384 family)